MEKEKKISISWGDALKYAIVFAAIISAYAAGNSKNNEQDRRIEVLEEQNKKYQELIATTAERVAEVNGKMDMMINYVQTINDNITDRGLRSRN